TVPKILRSGIRPTIGSLRACSGRVGVDSVGWAQPTDFQGVTSVGCTHPTTFWSREGWRRPPIGRFRSYPKPATLAGIPLYNRSRRVRIIGAVVAKHFLKYQV